MNTNTADNLLLLLANRILEKFSTDIANLNMVNVKKRIPRNIKKS